MRRLTTVLVLTAAFAPAAVMGALPLVAPVVVALTGVVLALSAMEATPVRVAEAVSEPVVRAER